MITVYSDDHRLQDGKFELIDGKLMPCFEMPRRADLVLARVKAVGLGAVLPPQQFGLDPVRRVHAPDFVEFLGTAWEEWKAEHGDYDALPLNWLAPGMRRTLPERIDGRLGYYSLSAAASRAWACPRCSRWKAATRSRRSASTPSMCCRDSRAV